MHERSPWLKLALLLATTVLLASSACPRGGGSRPNIVLVTVESLRSDRLIGEVGAPDPFANLRAMAQAGVIRPALSSSSETLPALATILTGASPARHATLEEGLDRLPADLPTLAADMTAAGYRTAGFPSLATLGLSSGLSRGFETYGFPPTDIVSKTTLSGSDQQGWMADSGRRPGQAAVADALKWAQRHRAESMFVWVHLSEATPPYATDRVLIETYRGSMYDAAMAYEDRCIKTLRDGFAELGLGERTIFVIAGDHGESLGEQGESFHGLNLHLPALSTAIVVAPPKTMKSAAGKGIPPGSFSRLDDLADTIKMMAGVGSGAGASADSPPAVVSDERPMLAVTLGPKLAFGWSGRVGLAGRDWIWTGPLDEEIATLTTGAAGAAGGGAASPADPARAAALKSAAAAQSAPIAARLTGRTGVPSAEGQTKLLGLMRTAVAAREAQNRDGEMKALHEAWQLDPGNFETARWLAHANGPKAVADNQGLLREVLARGTGLAEAQICAARMMEENPGLGDPLPAFQQACAAAGAGCAVDLALRYGRAGKFEDGAKTLAAVVDKAADPDLYVTLGDLYFAVENTYRAQQAYDRALQLRPGSPDVLLRQGDCFAALRNFKEATAKYEQARSAAPGWSAVEMRLGMMARQQGDRTAAVDHFRKALGVDTNTAAGEIALGQVLTEQGMPEEAVTLFHDAAARDTSSGEALYAAAEALASAGRLDEAEKDLRSALERDPNNPNTIYQLARMVVYRGDRKAGNVLLERLAEHTTMDIAVAALRDPLFTNDAPDAPLAKGMQALYAVATKNMPEGGMIMVPKADPDAPGGAGSKQRP